MSNSFIVVRHSYDDHSYIDGKNDTSLTFKGIEIAKQAIIRIRPKLCTDNVVIRHSSKRRASETGEIFCDYLIKNGYKCECINDKNLTELYQGRFCFDNMKHEEKIAFLQSCWDDFEDCRLNEILNHRFGEYKDENIMLIPGETHNEWANRISNGLLSTIDDIEKSYQVIDIAHRGAIYEIEQLVKLANDEIDFCDVEKYHTRWMEYCQDYILEFSDLQKAKSKIIKYKKKRS